LQGQNWGQEVSTNEGSPKFGERDSSSSDVVPDTPFTLRDLYVRASISGNSLAAELGRYLNIDENTFSSSAKSNLQSKISDDELSVHEQALAAILEVVTSNSKAAFEYVRMPEPQGGVQEWWARMLSGRMDSAVSTTDRSTTGKAS
jgi:hypothetical protein